MEGGPKLCSESDYVMKGKIGFGSFSTVWSATATAKATAATAASSSCSVAIKVMDLENISTTFEDILKEIQIMRLSDNPNILRCYCSFVRADRLWLVTPLMDKGSCLRVLSLSKAAGMGDGLDEDVLAYIISETIAGLHYLHSNGQIHRDIKSGNILLNGAGDIRISDFGVSGLTYSRGIRQGSVQTFVGTPCYMAPEVMEQAGGYDCKADIWSLGITSLELAKGSAPHARYSPLQVMVMTIEGDPPGLGCYENKKQRSGAAFSKAFEDFISKCLQKLPKTRPSSEDLQQHSFLRHRSRQALLLLLPKISSVDDDAVVAAGLHARSPPSNIAALGEGRSPAVGTSWVFDVDSDGSGVPQRGLHSSSSSRPRASPSSGAADVSSSSFHSESVHRISPLQSHDSVPAVAAKGGRGDGCGESINDFLSDFERDSATIKGGARDDDTAAAGRAAVSSTKSSGAVASMSSTEDFMSELEDIIR